ncbi:hypothetical protein VTK26DRAFT_8165 [Humicola hyalothermophila]
MGAPPDTMASAKIPANLPELVKTAFQRARASGDVLFFPTQVTLLNVGSVPFQLRFSPALASKPKAPQPAPSPAGPSTPSSTEPGQTTTAKPFFDPFDNPPPPMLITAIPPSHILVLNKFAVVPEHFILATSAFREQTHLLEPADLDVAYQCIEAYHNYHLHRHHRDGDEKDGDAADAQGQHHDQEQEQPAPGEGELFVFFNSGPHSGASQPHRHLQLLPVARMHEGLDRAQEPGWTVLARGLLFGESSGAASSGSGSSTSTSTSTRNGSSVRDQMPFATFAERITPPLPPSSSSRGEPTRRDLHATYLRLYRRACEAVLGCAAVAGDGSGSGSESVGQAGGEPARISYNLAMTRDVMVVMPRVAEGQTVTATTPGDGDRGDGVEPGKREVGKLALNGTVLAGTALVKSQAEWDALRREPEQLKEILGRIGVPNIQAASLL